MDILGILDKQETRHQRNIIGLDNCINFTTRYLILLGKGLALHHNKASQCVTIGRRIRENPCDLFVWYKHELRALGGIVHLHLASALFFIDGIHIRIKSYWRNTNCMHFYLRFFCSRLLY